MSDDRLRNARREAWRSFRHKLGIVVVALLAYGGLVSLGNAKHRYERDQKAKWQLTRETLLTLAKVADTVAPTLPATPSHLSGEVRSDTKLLHDIADYFKRTGSDVQGKVDTKQELVAAVEQIVDALIWRDTSIRISRLSQEAGLASDKKTDAPTTKDIEHYLDRVAGEESLARTRIAGTHALIEASATQIGANSKGSPPLVAMFDEKHPLYVLYEIGWYLLLALAVLASSWLLVTIFTVLPFTDAEGHWTERIRELLQKVAPSAASTALPFASAALVAATVFTGTGFATTPGGYARVVSVRTTAEYRSTLNRFSQSSTALTPQDLEKALGILQTTIAGQIGESEGHVQKTLETSRKKLNERLDASDRTQVTTLKTAQRADMHAGGAEASAQVAASQAKTAADRSETVGRTTGILSEVIIGAERRPEKPLVHNVGVIASDLENSKQGIGAAKTKIDAEYAEESHARNASLAQAAVVDPRGFLGRAFGRTLFKVGPAAVLQMAAFLHVPLDDQGKPMPYKQDDNKLPDPQLAKEYDDKAAFITLLSQATSLDPLHSGKFREALKGKAPTPTVKKFVDEYDRQLLHLCALQRD